MLYNNKDLQRIQPWSVLLLLWTYPFQAQFDEDTPTNQIREYPRHRV